MSHTWAPLWFKHLKFVYSRVLILIQYYFYLVYVYFSQENTTRIADYALDKELPMEVAWPAERHEEFEEQSVSKTG